MPVPTVPEPPPSPPQQTPLRPSFGSRLMGGLLLFWSLGLVSCQSLFIL